MQKHNDAIRTKGHSSLEKYTSHFICNGWKGLRKVMCERWVGDWRKTATYWPPSSSGHSSESFSFSWVAQPRAWGPASLLSAGSHSSIWNTDFKLWTFVLNSDLYSIQPVDSQGYPWFPDIFDRMHLLFTQVHFFFWQLGRGQYVTIVNKNRELVESRTWPSQQMTE